MQTILLPSVILIGGGTVHQAGAQAKALGLQRPLVVTDKILLELGATHCLQDSLQKAGYNNTSVFADTIPEPDSDAVDRLVTAISAGKHDGIIAIGGGSPIDTAKAAAVLARHGGHMRDYKAPRVVAEAGLPVIAIPTTAGTGSEVTKFSIITDSGTDEKMLCLGPAFLPRVAIVDYELTLTKPRRITADTGLDALTHAIESYVSRKSGPFTDALALVAMRALFQNIRTVCTEPDNRQAREAMMLASTQAGMAFSNASVALVHGMSRPIGAHFHVPHGLSNAMLLPTVTAFSASSALDRYADCARAMGISSHDDDRVVVRALIDALVQLNADLDVPTPRSFGIDEERYNSLIPTMVSQALASGSPANNPRVPTEAEFTQLYRDVWAEARPLIA
jgi:alcohol dehydrogenase class IV